MRVSLQCNTVRQNFDAVLWPIFGDASFGAHPFEDAEVLLLVPRLLGTASERTAFGEYGRSPTPFRWKGNLHLSEAARICIIDSSYDAFEICFEVIPSLRSKLNDPYLPI
jgi:hypothetical protein